MYRLKCVCSDRPEIVSWELFFRNMESAKRAAEEWDAARELDDGEWQLGWEVSPLGYVWTYGCYSEYIYYITPIVFEEDKPNA